MLIYIFTIDTLNQLQHSLQFFGGLPTLQYNEEMIFLMGHNKLLCTCEKSAFFKILTPSNEDNATEEIYI